MNRDDIDNQIIHLLFQTYRTMRRAMRFDAKLSNMTMVQMHILMYINNRGQTTTSEIAHEFKISLPTTTVVLDKLVESQYLMRLHDKNDHRVVRISLTKQGKAAFEQAKKERVAIMHRMVRQLNSDEKETFVSILKKIGTEQNI